MLAELGLFWLCTSAAGFLAAAGLSFLAVRRARTASLSALLRGSFDAGLATLVASALCFLALLVTDDFSVRYVAYNSNTELENVYKVAAFWAGHEGSFFLWLLLAGLAAGLTLAASPRDASFRAAFMGMAGVVLAALAIFLITASNPFARLLPEVPMQGRDLNPMLQDAGLIFHPPLLFAGYAALTAFFSASAAALWVRTPFRKTAPLLRRLALWAWVFLTAGNALGSWWAYTELGWGGWWFWDPVENSSFIPWLVVTGVLHALFLTGQEKLVHWLAFAELGLCLLGAFLVRSGMVQSVHAFAADKARGAALLALFIGLMLPALVLYVRRLSTQEAASEDGRRSAPADLVLTLGTYLPLAAAASVLFGTIYPLVVDVLGGGALTVGAPYFNAFFAPMAVLAALLIGMTQTAALTAAVRWGLAVLCLAGGGLLAWVLQSPAPAWTAAGFSAALWVASTAAAAAWHGGFEKAALAAHVGLAVAMVGATGVSNLETDAVVRMGPGLGKPMADLIFVYDETKDVETRAYFAKEARILVMNEAEQVQDVLRPQRQTYKVNGQQMTAAGIRYGLWRDLYVSMGNELGNGEYLVRISIKPLVGWLWMGALLMMMSGLALVFSGKKREAA